MDARSTSDPHPAVPHALPAARHATIWIGAAAGLLLAVSLALFWPGYVEYDSVGQYAQALAGGYDDWHPPIMAWLWALLHRVAAGAGPMLAVQLVGYWSGFGLIAAGLMRTGRGRTAVAVLLLACWPPFLGWEAVVLKDGQLLAGLLAMTGLVAFWRLADRPLPRWTWGLLVPVAGYALLVRANAVFAVAPLIVALIPGWNRRRRIAAGMALVVVTLAAAPAINHRLIGAASSGVERTQAVYDLAGIGVRAGAVRGGFTAAEVQALAARQCVRPFFWDPLGEDTRCGLVTARLRHVPPGRLYAALAMAVAAHPFAYAAHRLAHVNSTYRWWTPAAWPDAAPPRGSEPNDLGLGQPGPIAGAFQMLAGLALLTPLGWPVVWVVLAATALAATWRAPGSSAVVARALLLSSLSIEASFTVVSIASDLRYHLWPMVATALAVMLLAGEHWARRPRSIGIAGLAIVIAIAVVARLTLPVPPQSYQGMLG